MNENTITYAGDSSRFQLTVGGLFLGSIGATVLYVLASIL